MVEKNIIPDIHIFDLFIPLIPDNTYQSVSKVVSMDQIKEKCYGFGNIAADIHLLFLFRRAD